MRGFICGALLVATAVVLAAQPGRGQQGDDDQAAARLVGADRGLTDNQKAWISAKRDEVLPQIKAHEDAIKHLRSELERWESDVRKDKKIGPWRGKGK